MKLSFKLTNSFELSREKFAEWWKAMGRELMFKANANATAAIDQAFTQDNWKIAVIQTRQRLVNGEMKQGFKIRFK